MSEKKKRNINKEQGMAADSGMFYAEYAPKAVSRIDESGIEKSGTASGSKTDTTVDV